eukprot:Selendium_serpulae@DN5637_c0_g1_i8.p1
MELSQSQLSQLSQRSQPSQRSRHSSHSRQRSPSSQLRSHSSGKHFSELNGSRLDAPASSNTPLDRRPAPPPPRQPTDGHAAQNDRSARPPNGPTNDTTLEPQRQGPQQQQRVNGERRHPLQPSSSPNLRTDRNNDDDCHPGSQSLAGSTEWYNRKVDAYVDSANQAAQFTALSVEHEPNPKWRDECLEHFEDKQIQIVGQIGAKVVQETIYAKRSSRGLSHSTKSKSISSRESSLSASSLLHSSHSRPQTLEIKRLEEENQRLEEENQRLLAALRDRQLVMHQVNHHHHFNHFGPVTYFNAPCPLNNQFSICRGQSESSVSPVWSVSSEEAF